MLKEIVTIYIGDSYINLNRKEDLVGRINKEKYKIFLYKREIRGKRKLRHPKIRYLFYRLCCEVKEGINELPSKLLTLVKFAFAIILVGLVFCITYPLISGSEIEEFIINLSWEFVKSEIAINPWNIGWFLIYFALLGFISAIAFWGIPKFLDAVLEWGMGRKNDLTEEEIEDDFEEFETGVDLFFFFDSCNSGGIIDSLDDMLNEDYIYVATTCTADGLGYDYPLKSNGRWTYFFLEYSWINQHGGLETVSMETVFSDGYDEYLSVFPYLADEDKPQEHDGDGSLPFYL